MKNYLVLFLLSFSTVLSAAGKASDDGAPVIGVAMQGNKSTFIQFIVAGMYKYAEENPATVELKVVFAEDQADRQISQVESLIAAGAKAIILNPVSVVASAPAVDIANDANIPIVTVNTMVENQQQATAYVGSDDVEAGALQMQRLIDQINGEGNVAIIQAVIGHSAQIGRDKGYDQVLAKYPKVKVIYRQPADWSADKAQRLMENWLQKGVPIDAVATEVDTMAAGAIYAIEEKGIEMPPVGGMDAIEIALEMIGDGRMDNTIWQDGVKQGYQAVAVALKALRQENPKDVLVPFEVVTKDNLDSYRKKAEERTMLVKKYF